MLVELDYFKNRPLFKIIKFLILKITVYLK
jgi:hypothetical protein